MKRRIAIFHASVGTGYTAAARALGECWKALYPDTEVLTRDILGYLPAWLRKGVAASFLGMARRSPWLWERIYQDTDVMVRHNFMSAFWRDLHGSISKGYLKKAFSDLDKFDPDAVLVTHFFGMSALLDKWEHRTPIYFVDTDYATHSMQRDPRFDGWFVGSEESARQHRADNIPTPDVTVKDVGIPISPAYETPLSREEARRRLGFDDDRPTILIAGGGIGAGPLEIAAGSMVDCTEFRIEVVCGQNTRSYERIRDKYYPFKHIAVHGFVEDMRNYYAASDVVLLKPGGISLAEASASGAALLILDPLPGLEGYNCDYALQNGAARRVFENRRAGELVAELLKNPDRLNEMRARARALARPDAARRIVFSVMDVLAARER